MVQKQSGAGKRASRRALTNAPSPRLPAAPPIEPLALTIREAALVSCMSRSALFREIASGRLSVRKRGRKTLVLVKELQRYLAALPVRVIATPDH